MADADQGWSSRVQRKFALAWANWQSLSRKPEARKYLVWVGGFGGLFPFALSLFVFWYVKDGLPGAVAIGGGGQLWLLQVGFLSAALVYLFNGKCTRDHYFNRVAAWTIVYLIAAALLWALLTSEVVRTGNYDFDTQKTVLAVLGLPFAAIALMLGAVGIDAASRVIRKPKG